MSGKEPEVRVNDPKGSEPDGGPPSNERNKKRRRPRNDPARYQTAFREYRISFVPEAIIKKLEFERKERGFLYGENLANFLLMPI